METVSDDLQTKPIEALSYETPRPPAPGKRIGLVMIIGFALLGVSIIPLGIMMAAMDHFSSYQNVAVIMMGVIGGIIVCAGIALIVAAAWHMLRE